jgi:predicted ester cyclase
MLTFSTQQNVVMGINRQGRKLMSGSLALGHIWNMKIMKKHLHIYYVWNLKFEIIRFSHMKY